MQTDAWVPKRSEAEDVLVDIRKLLCAEFHPQLAFGLATPLISVFC